MAVRLNLRHDTTANWASSDPVLAQGEIGIDTTLRQAKVGDGATAWSSLEFGLGVDTDIQALVDLATAAKDAALVAQGATEDAADDAAAALILVEAAEAVVLAALGSAGNYYTDTTLAAAISTAEGALTPTDYYAATGDDVDWVGIYKLTTGPVSTRLWRVPKSDRQEFIEQFGSAFTRYTRRLAFDGSEKPKALVSLIVGQSLGAGRGGAWTQYKANGISYMPVGGATAGALDFFATNNDHCMDWNEIATFDEFTEGGEGQSPLVGIAAGAAGGKFARIYLFSAAVGSRPIATIYTGGERCNAHAFLERACQDARDSGYDPVVMIYHAHGEADSASSTGYATYVSRCTNFFQWLQLAGAQAMRKPGAKVPIFVTYPAQSSNGVSKDPPIRRALKFLCDTMPNVVNLGAIYQWGMNSDLVHPTTLGYVRRGERVGRAARQWFETGLENDALEIVDVTWNGTTTAVATFNGQITRDTSLGVAASLSDHFDGFQWFDNGSAVTITNVTYAGRKATITLNSTPAGTTDQQVLRYGLQVNSPLAAVPGNVSGGYVRRDETGWKDIYDGSYTNYVWASPQSFEDVRDA